MKSKSKILYYNEYLFFFSGTSTVASKYEELECLYAAVGKVIYEGLTNYEKATSNTNPTQLFGKNFFFRIFSCVASLSALLMSLSWI